MVVDPKLDRYWMQHCLSLAEHALGHTSPNPLVGSVIVAGQDRIAEGWHVCPGEPHAEAVALQQAGDRARGATLYVNLEPCNHTGRTPPCSEAIIKAGIQRVVVGMSDPNPLVAGQGIARLRQAGISVTEGVLEADCRRLNEAFCFSIVERRAFGLWKYAMTLDGKIAAASGDSQWVSGVAARTWVHQQRAIADAVVVGGRTVWHDDPRLTCRLAAGRNPWRVVLSHRLNLPRNAQLWQTEVAPTVVYCKVPEPLMRDHLVDLGVDVVQVPELSPRAVAEDLYAQGKMMALWECGGTVAATALETGAIQKVAAFVAPKLIGGEAAPSPLAGLGRDRMAAAWTLRDLSWQHLGDDLLLQGYVNLAPGPEETE